MKRIPVLLTDAQKSALRDYARCHDMTMSEVIVAALADVIPDFPMDKPQHGGWRGNEKSLENLGHYVDTLTDSGRIDPTD